MKSPSVGSPESFHTAQEPSPPAPRRSRNVEQNGADPSSMDADMDVDGDGKAASGTGMMSLGHRPVRKLPYELRSHIHVFIEERMYREAIQLLTSLLAAGGSDTAGDDGDATPVWVPPPSHLAVLATLAVHPAYTSRPQDGTDLRVAGHALQYLRHVLAVVGPVQAEMARAFAFKDAQAWHRQRGRLGRGRGPTGSSGSSRFHASGVISTSPSAGASASASVSASASASASASRASSARPRRRVRTSAGDGLASAYVDSTTLRFDDDATDARGFRSAAQAVAAAGSRMDLDYGSTAGRRRGRRRNGPMRHSGGGDDGGHNDDDEANGFAHGYAVHDHHDDDDRDDDGRDRDDDRDDRDDDDDDEAVGGRMATRDSVWTRGHDFWHVVAWALACSVAAPARWRAWQPWLTLVVDTVEVDLAERLARGDDLADTLLFQYLGVVGGGGGGGGSCGSSMHLRRIASAILADGAQLASATAPASVSLSATSSALVREVFDKETLSASYNHGGGGGGGGGGSGTTPRSARRRRLLDKFGGYSDDDESAPPTPSKRPGKDKDKDGDDGGSSTSDSDDDGAPPSAGNLPGFVESLPLRRRLLYLVTLGAVCGPADFAPPAAVYGAFAEVLRETEISVFMSFVAGASPAHDDCRHSSRRPLPATPDALLVDLLRHIVTTYLPASAPKPHVVDRDASGGVGGGVSARVLERCFLPFAANTVLLGANVRMALALESLLRCVWRMSGPRSHHDNVAAGADAAAAAAATRLSWTPALQAAAEAGVKARDERVRHPAATTAAATPGGGRRGKGQPPPSKTSRVVEAYGRDLLQRSGRRLLTMMQLLRLDTEAVGA